MRQATGQVAQLRLFLRTHSEKGIAEFPGPAGLHLDNDEGIPIASEDVDLAERVAPIPLDDVVADRLQILRRPIFTALSKLEMFWHSQIIQNSAGWRCSV